MESTSEVLKVVKAYPDHDDPKVMIVHLSNEQTLLVDKESLQVLRGA